MLTLLRRWLTISIPLLFAVSALTFLLVSLIPGDAARTIAGVNATPAQYEALRVQLGLDRPLWEQYVRWLGNALRGDFGRSAVNGSDVRRQLGDRAEVTITIVAGALIVATLLGTTLGVVSARGRRGVGRLTDALSLFGLAVPSYWFGLLLAYFFGVALGWFPPTGYSPIGNGVGSWLRSIALPLLTLGITASAGIAKQTRDAIAAEYRGEYVAMLRARGIAERTILLRHVLRNASAPIVTVIGLLFIGLLSGTVLVEAVFVLPGLGSLAVTSTRAGDIPVIQMVTVVFALLIVAVNLLVEVLYAVLDPKVRT